MSGSSERPRSTPDLGRVVAHAVLFPLAVTERAVRSVPATVERARRQIVLARFIGKMAVDEGARRLERQLSGPSASPTSGGPSANAPATRNARSTSTGARSGSDATSTIADDRPTSRPDAADHVPGPNADALALPDYDQLPAAQIVAMLDDLTVDERDEIESYEQSHRHRRTVLGKLDQLRAS